MKYGVIGEKLPHTHSPAIHSLLGNEAYEKLELSKESLITFMENREFKGINVTIPYKEEVMKYCNVSKEACEIGCVNTIVNRDGTLFGYNTDYLGVMFMLDHAGIEVEDKKVLILGSGGTSKTVQNVMKELGAREVIVIRRKGQDNYTNLDSHEDAQIIINTTPVGMYPHNERKIIDIDIFPQLEGVADVVYNPLRTNLILDCEDKGIKCTGGLSMLVAQAVYADFLFFPEKEASYSEADKKKIIEDVLDKIERELRNIVLIGMPGSGKTTIGKGLRDKMNLPFIDTDKEITKNTGKTPKVWIETSGEEKFRQIESEIVIKSGKKSGQIIATGGGSILLEENRRALRQNGTIVFISRPLRLLSTKDRPLSKDLKGMFVKRLPIYKQLADIEVKANKKVRSIIEEVEAAL